MACWFGKKKTLAFLLAGATSKGAGELNIGKKTGSFSSLRPCSVSLGLSGVDMDWKGLNPI
jgi:hypothetical protein